MVNKENNVRALSPLLELETSLQKGCVFFYALFFKKLKFHGVFFVYIIYSEKLNQFYKGQTKDLEKKN